MPSRLKQRDAIPVDPVDLGEGDVIYVRRWLTAEDMDEINSHIANVDMQLGTGTVDLDMVNRRTMLQAIVRWEGPGFCQQDHEDYSEHHNGQNGCVPTEPNLELLALLPSGDMNRVLTKIRAANPRAVAPGPLVTKATRAGKR